MEMACRDLSVIGMRIPASSELLLWTALSLILLGSFPDLKTIILLLQGSMKTLLCRVKGSESYTFNYFLTILLAGGEAELAAASSRLEHPPGKAALAGNFSSQ